MRMRREQKEGEGERGKEGEVSEKGFKEYMSRGKAM